MMSYNYLLRLHDQQADQIRTITRILEGMALRLEALEREAPERECRAAT